VSSSVPFMHVQVGVCSSSGRARLLLFCAVFKTMQSIVFSGGKLSQNKAKIKRMKCEIKRELGRFHDPVR